MEKYERVLENIHKVKNSSGRVLDKIQLVVVGKNQPWNVLSSIYKQGCLDFGESKVQEALLKIEEAPTDVRWHFVGSLQKNKVRKALPYFNLIHSVDSFELAKKISECSQELGLTTSILIQVNVSKEPTKQGFLVEDFWQNFEKILFLKSINIRGLMTIAPQTKEKKIIRSCFSCLREMQEKINLEICKKKPLNVLSMGMSDDYELAIEEGSTLLRIGRALF